MAKLAVTDSGGQASSMPSILIIEDEPDAAELLTINLRAAGFDTSVAGDGARGLKVALTTRPDLILLDYMLPSMSGVEVCQALRADATTSGIPIIMLTARAAENDRVMGLECGADDYVTKPYSMRELMLRVQGHLRRRKPTLDSDQRLVVGPFNLDVVNQTISIEGSDVRLTSTESKLLATLARAAGQAVPRQQLLKDVWGYSESTDTRTLDSHVRRLRHKLGPLAHYIETVQGVGYRLVSAQ